MNTDFEPEIVVLYCRQAAARGAGPADSIRRRPGFKARLIVMPCSSKVEIEYLVKLLERGVDGIQVVGCPERLCRFLVGNTKAEKRIEHVRRLLKEIGFGEERVSMVRAKDLSAEELLELAGTRADAVRALGPNPMKEKKRQRP